MAQNMPGHVRTALVLVVTALRHVIGPWGAFRNEVYDCEYDLGESACKPCRMTPFGAVFVPKPASCVMTDGEGRGETCCENNDGFQYFMKESLAKYHFGSITSMFYPSDDSIEWLAPNQVPAPGRCSWLTGGDLQLAEQARSQRRLAPARDA